MLLIDDVEIEGVPGLSVWIEGGRVREVGPRDLVSRPSRSSLGEAVRRVDGHGGALLPGLHDHHIHLFALAARAASVWCGPPEVTSEASLIERLRSAARDGNGEGWIRAVGWDDTRAGWPDRRTLDVALADRPVRLQHRSGAMWVLNSAALRAVGLCGDGDCGRSPRPGAGAAEVTGNSWRGGASGVELDADGSPTGRLTGLDDLMRERIADGSGEWLESSSESEWIADERDAFPSLREVSIELASRGVIGVTDATAHNGPAELAALAESLQSGQLVQRIVAMTRDSDVRFPVGVETGPVKLVLFDPDLPSLPDLIGQIKDAHGHGRAVALHAASRVGVVLALAALGDAGCGPGDRIEHASVVPDEMLQQMAGMGVTVVTQPHFIAESGDRYRATVEPEDKPWLYRGRAFIESGIPLAAGSDAPVGGHDPWAIMSAALQRRTASGHVMAPGERLTPEQALALFTGHPDRPGGPSRMIEPGAPADLCLLDRPWSTARRALADVGVRATIVAGQVLHTTE